jgi:hypothetical protein
MVLLFCVNCAADVGLEDSDNRRACLSLFRYFGPYRPPNNLAYKENRAESKLCKINYIAAIGSELFVVLAFAAGLISFARSIVSTQSHLYAQRFKSLPLPAAILPP